MGISKLKLVGGVLFLALLSACNSGGESSVGPSKHGPLETNMGTGGSAGLTPPGQKGAWQGMFGAMRLCVSSPGAVTITKVEPTKTSDGTAVRAVVRRVSGVSARAGETPIISLKGDPETEFATKAGQQVESAINATVSRVCSDDYRKVGFDELIVVLSSASAAAGNFISEPRIYYRTGGQDYVTTVPWVFGLCDQDEYCPGISDSSPTAEGSGPKP